MFTIKMEKVETVDLTATTITNNTLSDNVYGPKSITVSYLGFTTTLTVYLDRFSDVPYGFDFYHTIMDIANRVALRMAIKMDVLELMTISLELKQLLC